MDGHCPQGETAACQCAAPNLLRFSGEALTQGIVNVKVDDVPVRVYSPMKTVALTTYRHMVIGEHRGESRNRRGTCSFPLCNGDRVTTGPAEPGGAHVHARSRRGHRHMCGIVWGINLRLHEGTHVDAHYGRITNTNLADYLVPVKADLGDVKVSALDIPDTKLDAPGARGIGEIGITKTGAAVANAVYHATGKRVRDLPITPDKLL